jgi:hypothetical protein
MMARSHSAGIAYHLPGTLKASLSILAVLALCARTTYGAGNDFLFEAVRSGDVRKVRAALSQGVAEILPLWSSRSPHIYSARDLSKDSAGRGYAKQSHREAGHGYARLREEKMRRGRGLADRGVVPGICRTNSLTDSSHFACINGVLDNTGSE